jgi:cell volume regulation protein A
MHGLEVFELRLPPGANVTLVVRDGTSFVPDQRTVLRRGDQLLVVTTSAVRRDVLRRLRAVSRGGRLAVWEQSAPATRSAGRVAGDGSSGRPAGRLTGWWRRAWTRPGWWRRDASQRDTGRGPGGTLG